VLLFVLGGNIGLFLWHINQPNINCNLEEYEKMALIYKIFIFFDSKLKINKRNMNDNVAIFLYALLANRISSWFLNYSANFKRYFIFERWQIA